MDWKLTKELPKYLYFLIGTFLDQKRDLIEYVLTCKDVVRSIEEYGTVKSTTIEYSLDKWNLIKKSYRLFYPLHLAW